MICEKLAAILATNHVKSQQRLPPLRAWLNITISKAGESKLRGSYIQIVRQKAFSQLEEPTQVLLLYEP